MFFIGRYGTQQTFSFPMVKRGVVDFAVSADWTPAAADSAISKDGGNWVDTANTIQAPGGTPTRSPTGWKLTLSVSEMQAQAIDVQIIDAATKAVEDNSLKIRTLPADVYDALYGSAAPLQLVAAPRVIERLTQAFDTDATSHAVSMPVTVNMGDLLLVIFGNDGSATVTRPTGWAQLSSDANSTISRLSIYAKIAEMTESGTTVDFVTSAAEQASAIVLRIAGGTFFPEVTTTGIRVGTAATGTSTAPDSPAVTIPWSLQNVLSIACYAADDQAQATAYPAGYQNGMTKQGANAAGASVGTAENVVSVLSENPGTFTIASQEWIAQTIIIRPAKPDEQSSDILLRRSVAQVGAAGTITLDENASASDDFYNDCIVAIIRGTGRGQARFIPDYTGSTKVANVTPNWITTPDSTSEFLIFPSGRVDLAMWLGAVPNALSSGRADVSVGAMAANVLTAAAVADGAIDDAAVAADMDAYSAKVWMNKQGTTADKYGVVWFKNGQPILSGITSPTIQVIKSSDGTDLIASTAMTEVGSLHIFKKEETTNTTTAGDMYWAKVQATIDGATRTWLQPVPRDSA